MVCKQLGVGRAADYILFCKLKVGDVTAYCSPLFLLRSAAVVVVAVAVAVVVVVILASVAAVLVVISVAETKYLVSVNDLCMLSSLPTRFCLICLYRLVLVMTNNHLWFCPIKLLFTSVHNPSKTNAT